MLRANSEVTAMHSGGFTAKRDCLPCFYVFYILRMLGRESAIVAMSFVGRSYLAKACLQWGVSHRLYVPRFYRSRYSPRYTIV
jgi:hypothetical protein